MKLGSDQWRETIRVIYEALKAYHINSDMGASTYQKEGSQRSVLVKHRMRKDKEAVTTLDCRLELDSGLESTKICNKTVGLLGIEQAQTIADDLLTFLESGEVPERIMAMPTYPGYEFRAL